MFCQSGCLLLKLILLKNCLIRKRHYIQTLLEIGTPLLFFYLLRQSMSHLESTYIDNPTYGHIHSEESLYLMYLYSSHGSQICYAPKTEFTSELIKNLKEKLKVDDKDVKGLKSESEVFDYYQTYGRDKLIEAIIFKNDSNNKRLEYVLRPAEMDMMRFRKKLIEDLPYSPHRGSNYYFSIGALAIQMALDTSYIEMVSKKKLPVEFTMQELPYPPHLDDNGKTFFYQNALPPATFYGFFFIYPFILLRVMDEKATGIKELMKMVGMKSWTIWLGWALHTMIVNVISVLCITLYMKGYVFSEEEAMIPYSSATVIAVFLILYCINLTTFAFVIGSLFKKYFVALISAVVFWAVLGYVAKYSKTSLSKKILICIFTPLGLLENGYDEMLMSETRESGLHWSNLFQSTSVHVKELPIGMVFILFIISSIMCMLLTVYIEAVRPGPYGIAKPLNFPVLYIWSKFSRNNSVEDEEASSSDNTAKIEKPQTKLNIGIKVKNLYKKFGTNTVVDNLTIDIYEGQITVLLGHNGAGKTTTMSIITGMIGATSGKVLINNKDIKYHMDEIRHSLGFCPQHNLHFTDLTVMEHLIFFAMVKGSSYKKAWKESDEYMKKVNLVPKRNSLVKKLSGGMLRKLSLGMALIGNSKVLILDEPTSGLDPESRREIWDTLLTYRGSRTIIITTHFMEEADVLGDRIAIMDHGKLICYGSSMYLKKEYGAGYNLTLVRDEAGYKAQKPNGPNQIEALTSIVVGRIRSAYFFSASGNRVIFILPFDMKPYFGELLEAVENKKEELFITNIALCVTTMEEVFLNVDIAAEENKKDKRRRSDTGDDNISFVTNPTKKQVGLKLFMMQVCRLFKKRALVQKRKWMFYVIGTLIAIAATILTLYLGEDNNEHLVIDRFKFDLNNYGKTSVYYSYLGDDLLLADVGSNYSKLVKLSGSTAENVRSVSEIVLEKGKKNFGFYKDFLMVAAEFNGSDFYQYSDKTVNAMYSYFAYHGAPISLSLVTNAVLKGIMGNKYGILASIDPLPELLEVSPIVINANISAKLWILFFTTGILLLIGSFLVFPHMERVSKVKQLQLMCGIRAVVYWLVCYLFDLLLYLIAVMLIICSLKIYGHFRYTPFSGSTEVGYFLLLLLIFGLSAIPYAYLFTYKKTMSLAFAWLFILNYLLAIIIYIGRVILDKKIDIKLRYLICLLPHPGLTMLLARFAFKVVAIYTWDNYTPEEKNKTCESYKTIPCCAGEDSQQCIKYRSYLSSNYKYILIMLASSILYFTILLLLESNFLKKLLEKVITRNRLTLSEQDDVDAEMKRIDEIIKKEKKKGKSTREDNPNEEDLLLVHNLQKNFSVFRVLKSISFAAKPGECFGLLGVNGAGKTTTFRILTGDLPLIYGEARILTPAGERIYFSKQYKKFLKNVGYCPQFDALNEVLTGREMLKLFADLRGVSERADEEINMWINILGLEEFANKPCGVYSGGNKRKLSVAIALLGGLPVVMLDEPTSGVDPVSRRKLWDTLTAIQRQEVKPSIILTSHSMDECEALCNNLAIMKAGQLQCYGTIPNIKKKFAQGFTIILKLRSINKTEPVNPDKPSVSKSSPADPRSTDENLKQIENLINDFEIKYQGYCKLKDRHVGLLHFHINDKNKKLSKMYKEIEQLQQTHPIIEDYNISETTLEEVFLLIARQH